MNYEGIFKTICDISSHPDVVGVNLSRGVSKKHGATVNLHRVGKVTTDTNDKLEEIRQLMKSASLPVLVQEIMKKDPSRSQEVSLDQLLRAEFRPEDQIGNARVFVEWMPGKKTGIDLLRIRPIPLEFQT